MKHAEFQNLKLASFQSIYFIKGLLLLAYYVVLQNDDDNIVGIEIIYVILWVYKSHYT